MYSSFALWEPGIVRSVSDVFNCVLTTLTQRRHAIQQQEPRIRQPHVVSINSPAVLPARQRVHHIVYYIVSPHALGQTAVSELGAAGEVGRCVG